MVRTRNSERTEIIATQGTQLSNQLPNTTGTPKLVDRTACQALLHATSTKMPTPNLLGWFQVPTMVGTDCSVGTNREAVHSPNF
jgi:hypothetical protein